MADLDPYRLVARAITSVENRTGNPAARNPRSSAMGDGQFVDGTWLAEIADARPDLTQGRSREQILALRANPALAEDMVVHLAKKNAIALAKTGVPVTPETLYLAHFAGVGGAQKAIDADINAPINTVLGEDVVAANPHLRGMTPGKLFDWAASSVNKGFDRVASATKPKQADEFDTIWGIEAPKAAPVAARAQPVPAAQAALATAAQAPDGDDFDKLWGIEPPKAAEAPKPVAPETYDPNSVVMPQRFAKRADKPEELPIARVADAAVREAQAAFGESPIGMGPETRGLLESSGIYGKPGQATPLQAFNEALINPLAAGVDIAWRGANALFRGGQGAVAQAGAEVGQPQLGRDIAALPEVLLPHVGGMPRGAVRKADAPNPLAAAAESHTARLEAPLAPEFVDAPGVVRPSIVTAERSRVVLPGQDDMWPQAPVTNALAAPKPAEPINPLNGTPAPNSVGAAATPTNMTPMGAREAAASRATGDMQRVFAPAKEGVDTTIYVPGTIPTEAEVAGNPAVAFEQKVNRQHNPEPHLMRERQNNDARVEYYEQQAGTPTIVNSMREDRSAQAVRDIEAAFKAKKPTDAQPVVDTINEILSNPRDGENSAVQQYVRPFLDRLTDKNGKLKSDPEQLYGLREDVNRMLSKAAKAETPTLDHVSGQLTQIKSVLDSVIEAGAPGYKQYLENFAAASRPIDAMEYLQEARSKLTNSNGVMTPAAFDRFMKDTIKARMSGGVHPAKSLTDEQMDVLHNLHADLKRFNNINMANPRGSDTSMLMGAAKTGGKVLAHAAANAVSPLVGSIGVQMFENQLSARNLRKTTERVLNPSPKKYPPQKD